MEPFHIPFYNGLKHIGYQTGNKKREKHPFEVIEKDKRDHNRTYREHYSDYSVECVRSSHIDVRLHRQGRERIG